MAELTAIRSTAAAASSLALGLYRLLASNPSPFANELGRVARSISCYSSTLKHLGTVIGGDDTLMSPQAGETLGDILNQSHLVLNEIESSSVGRYDQAQRFELSAADLAWLAYLRAHLVSLECTVSVLQQTLYTAQTIMWARVRPTVSPQQVADDIANEKAQLENAVIEQQLSILLALKRFEPLRPGAKRLMETETTSSLMAIEKGVPKAAHLLKYQAPFLASLDVQEQWLPALWDISKAYLERLLEQWTRLRQFHQNIDDQEQQMDSQKREAQQPTVESDDDEEHCPSPTLKSSSIEFSVPTPRRPESVQPLFPESMTFSSSPSLGIPWTLRSRRQFWKFIDNKVQDSTTNLPSSEALLDRNSRTEILASWVCEEAIREQRYKYTSVQKDIRDGRRRTMLEKCFCIEQALTFEQVEHLVERTVHIYRSKQLVTPPPSTRRSSLHRRESHGQDIYCSPATSDSDDAPRRSHRSRSRTWSTSSQNKKKKQKAVGTLATVGVLTGLLDGMGIL